MAPTAICTGCSSFPGLCQFLSPVYTGVLRKDSTFDCLAKKRYEIYLEWGNNHCFSRPQRCFLVRLISMSPWFSATIHPRNWRLRLGSSRHSLTIRWQENSQTSRVSLSSIHLSRTELWCIRLRDVSDYGLPKIMETLSSRRTLTYPSVYRP